MTKSQTSLISADAPPSGQDAVLQDFVHREIRLQTHGAEHYPAALSRQSLRELSGALSELPQDDAGIRIRGVPALHGFLSCVAPIGRIAADVLGTESRAVRAILFNKTAVRNWGLAWHQDRTIVVRERKAVVGFGPWTTKAGLQHVAPADLLSRMLTLRVHLDPVPTTNAPLLIAPGSHRLGRIPEADIPAVVRRCGSIACLAEVGDIWLYSTPILHSSEASMLPAQRRVLQVDFAAEPLPGGLEWLGV